MKRRHNTSYARAALATYGPNATAAAQTTIAIDYEHWLENPVNVARVVGRILSDVARMAQLAALEHDLQITRHEARELAPHLSHGDCKTCNKIRQLAAMEI